MVFEQYISNSYLRALAIIFLVFVFLKLVVFIIERVLLSATRKTKTDIDDKIIEKSSKPISAIILLFGLRLAINEFAIPEFVMNAVAKIIYSFMIIFGGYIAYVIIDLVIIAGWKKISIKTKSKIDDSLASLTHSFLKVIWIVLVFLYVLHLWGIQIGPFLAGLGIGGIAIAFALQESLSNIFGGISIILDKTVKKGDIIYLDAETRGEILDVGIRSTKINTFDNEVVIVPNSIVANSKVQNIGQPEPKSRVVVPFGVAYGSDVNKVKKIVMTEIKKIKHFVNEPEPVIRFLEMADSSLNFKVFFYVDSFENRYSALDEANTRIYNALNKAGVSIPFPQMDVHLKK
jgi:MscS family membrane protein